MLHRYSAKACRCASTSLAPPCRHSHSSSSRSAPSPQPAHPHPQPLDYAAPLFPVQSRPSRWFSAPRPGWAGWLRDAVVPLSPSDSPFTFPPDLVPPSSAHISPTRTLASASFTDDDLTLLSTYFTERGPRTALSAFRDEYGALLAIAEQGKMPLLEAMVKEDVALRGLGHRQVKKLDVEGFASGKRVSEEGGLGEGVVLERPVAQELPSEPVKAAAKVKRKAFVRKERYRPVVVGIDFERAKQELSQLTIGVRGDEKAQAFVASLKSTIPARAFTSLWTAFERSADLSDSASDLRQALFFLHYITAPTPPSSTVKTQPYLSLSLRILRSLLAFLPDEVLAAEPTLPSSPTLSEKARVQAIVLRTVVNIALAEQDIKLLPLAVDTLRSLDQLVSTCPSLSPADSADAVLDRQRLTATLDALLSSLSTERTFVYRPSTLHSSSTSPTSLLSLSSTLLDLHYNSLASSAALPLSLRLHLDSFASEAIVRYRWDLLLHVWERWSPRGWVLHHGQLKLARWLVGEAPFSTYGVLEAPQAEGTVRAARSTRLVRTEAFTAFATATHRSLRETDVGRSWTLAEKNEWIEMLVTSKGANRQTQSLARRIATFWQEQQGSGGGFMLSAQALLALLRTAGGSARSSSPASPPSPWAQRLLSTHVTQLISPSSPFSASPFPSPSSSPAPAPLTHFDLTTLAQAYGILYDWVSVAQVYRKLLEQKILPDAKDVEVILGTGPGRDAGTAVEMVRLAQGEGVRVGEAGWRGVLRGLLRESETMGERKADGKAGALLALAEASGVEKETLQSLREYASVIRRPSSPQASMAPSLDVLDPDTAAFFLRRALSATPPNLPLALHLFNLSNRSTSAPTSSDLRRLLRATVLAYPRTPLVGRHTLRKGLRKAIDLALPVDGRGGGLIDSSETLDWTLRALIKLGDVEAVDALMARLKEGGRRLEPSRDVEEMVVRWAIWVKGKRSVKEGKGWVGEKARVAGAEA